MQPSDKDRSLITTMIHALEHPHKPLTKWEQDFIYSINDQWTNRGSVTDKQFAILERIYTEKTP
jgi:hypothetical protein